MFADATAVLVESCLRASVVLGAAWALTSLMPRAAASTRHFVWSCAIAGSIVAAGIGITGPRWSVPVPAAFVAATPVADTGLAGRARAPIDDAAGPARDDVDALPASSSAAAATAKPSRRMDSAALAIVAWAVGASLVLAYALAGVAAALLIRRSATPLRAPWVDEARVLAEALEVPGSIEVVESKAVATPLVCGLWRPMIVLPSSAAHWSDQRRRVVVLHELAHIKRRDCLTQAIAQIVCAAYWFNPLAWLAARRLRAERERACDDFVLAAGADGPDYAAHLLDIAQNMKGSRIRTAAGLAMARPSQLEGRLLAILDPAVRRSSARYTRAASFAVVLLITVPVGAVRLQGSMPVADDMETARGVARALPAVKAASPAPTPTPIPTPVPTPMRVPASQSQVESVVTTEIVVDPAVIVDAERIAIRFADTTNVEIRDGIALGREIAAAMAQAAAAPDPKAVEALIGALADPDPGVRETVVATLGRMRDPRVVDALLPLIKDGNADVREQVVSALAHSRDARAAAAVAGLIDDPSPDVRQQAVQMLGRLRNRDALPQLLKALNDSSADVREQAVSALGHFRDASTVDPLIASLKDSSPEVREQAVAALGHIRDRRAADPLIAALADTSADVREQAASALGHLRDPKALTSLTNALRDSSADVREQAARAIGLISGQ